MRRVEISVILMFLLVGMLVFASGVKLGVADGTIYIRADGSIDPPTAPIQRDGTLYTLTGNITSIDDGIVIERDNIVIDGSGFGIEGPGGSSGYGIYLDGRTNVTIQNTSIRKFTYGVGLYSSPSNSIDGNTITNNNYCGIWLASSLNNSMSGNTITNNFNCGIGLICSLNNSMSGNTITNNTYHGILVAYSSNNSMSGNTITNNTYYGIWLGYSSNNSISGNTITDNRFFGINLELCSNNNRIGENTLANNGGDGAIAFWNIQVLNNTVCHNNFINNSVQVDDRTPEYANFWDNGCEGNFWSNYNGTDLDKDRVGDTFLPWEDVDNYPLMNVYWNPCDISHDLKVDMRDIGVSAKAFGTSPSNTLWNPHADTTGPEPLVPDGKVDTQDISLIAKHYGEHYP